MDAPPSPPIIKSNRIVLLFFRRNKIVLLESRMRIITRLQQMLMEVFSQLLVCQDFGCVRDQPRSIFCSFVSKACFKIKFILSLFFSTCLMFSNFDYQTGFVFLYPKTYFLFLFKFFTFPKRNIESSSHMSSVNHNYQKLA